MPNPEHLAILKQGVEVWNRWRDRTLKREATRKTPFRRLVPDLSDMDLSSIDLSGANLASTNLERANFDRAKLSFTNFDGANLQYATFRKAECIGATFNGSNLTHTSFDDAVLAFVAFGTSYLDLRGRAWGQTGPPVLRGTSFLNTRLADCIIIESDLSDTIGLETVRPVGLTSIDLETVYRSKGLIPDSFLRGVGVPESFVAFQHSLVTSPIDLYSCFISYSSKDQVFAERLHSDLRSKNVRCWFAPEDLTIGAELRPTFDEAIRLRDKLLLVLSEHSIRSPWVKREIEQALDEEQRRKDAGRQDWHVLFPIRLDNSIFQVSEGWATDVKRRHIGDFRNWKDHDSYQHAFDRLLRDLKAEASQETR